MPLATLTGWGLRAAAFGGDDLCDSAGQQIDLHQTKDERLAAGDPRLSIEERYPTHWRYVKEVTHAVRRLGRERFLLDEDVQRYIEQADGQRHRQVALRASGQRAPWLRGARSSGWLTASRTRSGGAELRR